jgi:hypothetical protein
MARGRFNKRGGGPRLDAQSAEEIEYRNRQLAELEEARANRRADSDDEEEKDGEAKIEKDPEVKKAVVAAKPAKVAAVVRHDVDNDNEEDGEPEGDGGMSSSKKPKGTGAPVVETSEADHRRNMAKLAEVRKRREEAEARRKEQEEAAQAQEEELRKLAAMTMGGNENDDDSADGKKKKKSKSKEIPKLDKVAIKRMKPAQLKEALKERNLDYQGNAKALLDRLIKYESER